MNLVSVIVPVYNAEKCIEKCVDSILKQSYKNLEIILVDDGSTDSSSELCDRFEMEDERIHVIHKKNGGLCDARNTGVKHAKGKYITFVDNDDIINSVYVETLYDICETHECDIAQCDFLMVNDDSELLPAQMTTSINIYDRRGYFRTFYNEANLVRLWVAWNKMYRRELFEDVQYPVGRIHDDMYTTHKLLWKAGKIAVTNQYLYYYFQREGSLTGKKNSVEERIDVIEALKEEKEFLKDNKLHDEYAFILLKLFHTLCNVNKNRKDYVGYSDDIEHYDRVMAEYAYEAEKIKKEYLNLPNLGLKDKILSLSSELSNEEKESYHRMYGIEFSPQNSAYFEFPKEKVKKNELIAIYGAGAVGQSFYKQIIECDYCRVIAWVDNGFKNYIRIGLPVQPIDALFRSTFDKIIIAVLNKTIAYEIVRNLKEWGIEEKKIIVAFPAAVDRTNKMLYEFQRDTAGISGNARNERFFLVNTPDHDNLGDHLLTLGAIKFFNDYFPDNELIEITGRQWDACKENIIQKVRTQDVICIVGGGFMGDLWPVQDGRVKEIIGALINNRIIFLPQTFFYSDNSEMISSDVEFYKNIDRVLFIHREKKSYNYFKSNIAPNHMNVCFPDTALYLNQIKQDSVRKGGLMCFRLDKESQYLDNRGKICEYIKAVCNTASIIDTVLDRSVLRSERKEEVNKILELISKSEILITDRLHAMVMAVITGTPCIAVDNLSKKVSGVYEWIKDLDYIVCVSADKINIELISEYMTKKHNIYNKNIVEPQFKLMCETIKDWL